MKTKYFLLLPLICIWTWFCSATRLTKTTSSTQNILVLKDLGSSPSGLFIETSKNESKSSDTSITVKEMQFHKTGDSQYEAAPDSQNESFIYFSEADSPASISEDEYQPNARAIWLLIFSGITIVLCCIGIHWMLQAAKESKRALIDLQRRRERLGMSDQAAALEWAVGTRFAQPSS